MRLNPSTADIARIHQLQEEQARERTADQARAHEPATTLDGHRVEVAANIGGLADAQQGIALGAEAVGLLRSEFLFLQRTTAPTEEEQRAVYRDVARALGPGRRLVVRTLDVGGDKPLPYLPLPREDNPFLGERGIRVMLNRPELLRTQLRAILGAARDGSVAVMFPMIATLDEWRTARAMLEEERQRLDAPRIEAGIMVEVAVGGAARRPVRHGGGLLFDRHQRPHPVHAGDGSRSSAARAAGGRAVARRARV